LWLNPPLFRKYVKPELNLHFIYSTDGPYQPHLRDVLRRHRRRTLLRVQRQTRRLRDKENRRRRTKHQKTQQLEQRVDDTTVLERDIFYFVIRLRRSFGGRRCLASLSTSRREETISVSGGTDTEAAGSEISSEHFANF
jgi:hypothetical protein